MIPTDKPIELCYSGGKDSDVILHLARMADIPFEAIYKNTTIDPPGTIQHCKENGVTILNPKTSFLKLIEKHGMPTMRARFCCSELKEYKVYDVAIQGIRRSESVKRASRYKEPQVCRFYGSKKNHVSVWLPILDWTDEDVKEFIEEEGIKCHPLYYDDKGAFHVERRLGCIGCPLRSDRGKGEYIENPKMFKAVMKALLKWWDSHPCASSHKKFSSAYELAYHNLFCDSYQEYESIFRGGQLFDLQLDAKQFLEDYFKINLD